MPRNALFWAALACGVAPMLLGLWYECMRWRDRRASQAPTAPDVLIPEGWKRWHYIPADGEMRQFVWRKGKWRRTRQTVRVAELEEHE